MRSVRALTKYYGLVLLGVLSTSAAACGPSVDLTAKLPVQSLSTGWVDVGNNKVVPALSFTLKNVSDQKLRVLQVNAQFQSADAVDQWGTAFLTVADFGGLAPDATTTTLVLKGQHGYIGAGVQRMVGNFVETKVKVFAKYGSAPWTPIGEYPVARQLMR